MIPKMTDDSREEDHSSSLLETSRRDLISQSRRGSKKRYNKRINYQVSNFKGVDLAQLFENDYFVFKTPINDYECVVAFPEVLDELKKAVKPTNGDANKVTYQMVLKALRASFDKTDDVKVRCSCADFHYRFEYWADRFGYLYGEPADRADEFPEKTNPDNNIGATCKHLDLFLSSKRWLIKAASVVTSLIKTYPEKAAFYLYDEEDLEQEEPEETEEESEEVEETSEEEAPEEVEEPVSEPSSENGEPAAEQ